MIGSFGHAIMPHMITDSSKPYRPNLLIVGSTMRNLGKTTFICRLIPNLSSDYEVIVIKATCRDDPIPSHLTGCDSEGELLSQHGSYTICHMTDRKLSGKKDTDRYYRAGAHQVYWIRSSRKELPSAFKTLFSYLDNRPDETLGPPVYLAESASARTAVLPGLFIMLTADEIKPSAQTVLPYADLVLQASQAKGPETYLTFNGTEFRLRR